MGRAIELPDEVYRDLERVAGERGLTPAAWIASTLHSSAPGMGGSSLVELLRGLVGAVDSESDPRAGCDRDAFGDLLARKFQKQGLRKP